MHPEIKYKKVEINTLHLTPEAKKEKEPGKVI